ncbi:ABC transporter B family member 28 [Tetrabaena socialis]|uniref:ABC transporter B family member 28 n=1 Tax=Tetrabaena socialis TaxID=47790 RepID=A0A2J8AIV4_9CHLO|nr:ABC transporter B family member 28 [Tetrabaena socialis]|eukprot:PNH12444.1 ABC transporter B family member 28 [Tetrabaena socialis]
MQRAAMVLWLAEEAEECMVVDDGGLNPTLQGCRGLSARPSAAPPPQPTGDARFLLSDTQELQQLGLLLAAWLLGPDPDGPQWLSGRLSRLQGCASLQDLVGELCGAVAEHVRRCFLVEAGVSAALVPAQDAAVGLMLRPEPGRVAASTAMLTATGAPPRPGPAAAASSSALSGVVEDVGEYLQGAKNPCGDVCCLVEQAQQQQYGGGESTPMTAALGSLVLLPLLALEESTTMGLYVCFPQQLPGSLLGAVRKSCAELVEAALLVLLRRKLRGPLAAEYETLRSAVPGSYAVFNDTMGEYDRAAVQGQQQPVDATTLAFATTEFGGATTQKSAALSLQASVDEIESFFVLPTHGLPEVAVRPQSLLRHQPSSLLSSHGGSPRDPTATATATARALRHVPDSPGRTGTSRGGGVCGKSTGDTLAMQTCPADARERQAELLNSASSFIVVTGPDHASSLRTRMDMLVGSVGASMGAAAAGGGAGGRIAYPEDLEMLELGDELGRGGAGVVYRGRLATVEVAVKLMEVLPVSELGDAGSNRQAAEQQLRQQRELLRSAMEMVVQSNVSHPQIVQLYSVYRGVRKVEVDGRLHLRCGPGASSVGGVVAAADAATGGDQGKSTVAALLSRFYEPQEGSILLDGQPITSFSRGEWAKAVSLVSQDPVLFSGTIGDNIAYGILMWEMLAGGVRPFTRTHPDLIPRCVLKGVRPTLGPEVPLWYRCLAQACWAADPRRRPTAHELVVALNGHLQDGAAADNGKPARGG